MSATVPDYTLSQYYPNGSGTLYSYGGRLPVAFCYQLGTEYNYHFSSTWSLMILANYSHSTPGYHDGYEYNGVKYQNTYTYPVSCLNLLAGITYSL